MQIELTAADLEALVHLVTSELSHAKHTHPDDQSCRPILRALLPKLKRAA